MLLNDDTDRQNWKTNRTDEDEFCRILIKTIKKKTFNKNNLKKSKIFLKWNFLWEGLEILIGNLFVWRKVVGVNTVGSSGSSVSVFVTLTAFIDNVLSLIWRLKNEQWVTHLDIV
jgi:hypothetical protein